MLALEVRGNARHILQITSFSRAAIITSCKITNQDRVPAKTRAGTMNIRYRVYFTF